MVFVLDVSQGLLVNELPDGSCLCDAQYSQMVFLCAKPSQADFHLDSQNSPRVRTAIYTGSAGLETQKGKVAVLSSSSHHLEVSRQAQPSVWELYITTEGSFVHKQTLLGGMCCAQCQCREVCGLVSRTTEPCILREASAISEVACFFRVLPISPSFIPETKVLCIHINT